MNNKSKSAPRALAALLAGCCLWVASSARAADVIAHWSFDELAPGGRSFPNTNGSNLLAIITSTSSASMDNGKDVPFGKAVSLGPGGTGLDIPPFPASFYDHSFTVASWVKLADTKDQYVLSDWGKNDQDAYAFGFNGGKVMASLRTAKLTSKGQTSDIWNVKNLNVPITTGAWHHVAWVWTHTGAKAGKFAIYLDGTKAGETNMTGKSSAVILNNAHPAHIGFKADSKVPFHGSIDELWIFGDALTADEITNLMKSNDIAGGSIFASAGASPTTPSTPAATSPPANTDATSAATTTPPASPTTPAPDTAAGTTTPTPASPSDNAIAFTPAAPTTPSTPSPAASRTPPLVTPAPPASVPMFNVTRAAPTDTPPVITTPVADVLPPHYTPGRIAGIIASGTTALMLSGFLLWAVQERGRQRHA